MVCSEYSRCQYSNLIYFDNIFICKNCNSIFKKSNKLNKKLIVNCCNNQSINKKYNIPICNNCLSICVINI